MTKRYDMTKKPGYYNDDTVMKTQEGKESKQGATPGHTPGPWVVHNNGLSIGIEGKIKGVVEVSLATTTLGGRANENRANARLIAAAPELLEVAIKLKGYAWANNPDSLPLELRAIINEACDAVQKAEGRS